MTTCDVCPKHVLDQVDRNRPKPVDRNTKEPTMAPAEGATMDHRTAANARAMRSKQSGTYRLSSTPRPRRLVALMAAITLAFGGSLMAASTASAAPGDPVIFADQNLEDAVNDELGQNSGDTITEAQA